MFGEEGQEEVRLVVTPRRQEKALEKELISLFHFIKKQSKVVYNIKNDAYQSGLETINIPTADIDQLHLPTRDKFAQLFRVLDKRKVNETKVNDSMAATSPTGDKRKDDSIVSQAAEEVKQSLQQTLQKVGEDLTQTIDPKLLEESMKPLDVAVYHDLQKMEKRTLGELVKKIQDQVHIAKTRLKILTDKLEQQYSGGNIAEFESAIEDKKYYEGKLAKLKLQNKQLVETVKSQQRLLNKEELKKTTLGRSLHT